MEIFCFFAGIALISMRNLLPLSILVIALFFRQRLRLICFFLLAILWAIVHEFLVADRGLPSTGIARLAELEGNVITIPVVNAVKTQFQYKITSLNHHPVSAVILMSCYKKCADVHFSEHLILHATLRRARNLSNPGGFDYVNWLKARHLKWSGTAVPGSIRRFPSNKINQPWMRVRAVFAGRLAKVFFDPRILGVIQALTLGITTHIDQELWTLFRQTGTTHLMVISGAHIGLIAGLVYSLVKQIVCYFEFICLRVPAQKIASVLSFSAALIYSLLAGFAVPAQRAMIMTFFVLLRTVSSNKLTSWQSLRYALLTVLIWEPHAVLLPGFYLSFLAVTCLMITHQRFKFKGIKKLFIMQLACLFGLMPLTLYWFSYGAVNGLIANALAIPWVSFVVVPLALLSMLLGLFISINWMNCLLHVSITLLLRYLTWVDSCSWVNITTSFQTLLPPIGLMTAMLLILLMPWRSWWHIVGCLFVGAVFPAHEQLANGSAQVNVLDVGQGLAVVVRTANHVLVYDTGMQFYQGSDMGAMVVVPYLQSLGVKKLDKIIISHPDLDHRGGLISIDKAYPGTELVVDNPSFYHRGVSCHQARDWVWDGVKFHFFSLPDYKKTKNNTSCVLQIIHPLSRVLLTGDIEKQAEKELVKLYGSDLASTVIVVPHHGSKTSSSMPFINAVGAKYAILSYGYDNKYRFPHLSTIRVYQEKNISLYNTVKCGMTSILLSDDLGLIKPSCFKKGLFAVDGL